MEIGSLVYWSRQKKDTINVTVASPDIREELENDEVAKMRRRQILEEGLFGYDCSPQKLVGSFALITRFKPSCCGAPYDQDSIYRDLFQYCNGREEQIQAIIEHLQTSSHFVRKIQLESPE